MTMTNQTVRDAVGNIAQDVDLTTAPKGQYGKSIALGQNVRTASGQVLSPEAQIMFSASVVAKNLGAPASEEIHIKNLSFHYYWGNRSGAGGRRYAKLKAMGYENATLDDVTPMAVEIKKEQAEICLGDLILMKIPIERWMAHEKAKMEKALHLQRRAKMQYASAPNPDINSDDTPQMTEIQNQSGGDGKYMTHFVATEAELNAKMGPDQAGRKK